MLPQKKILHLLDAAVVDRFMSKVRDHPHTNCRLWTGATRGGEYGIVCIKKTLLYAHRVAFVIYLGRDVQEGFVVDHRDDICYRKDCVAKNHLQEVEQKRNVELYHSANNPFSLCKAGHARERGKVCKICNALRQREWQAARRKEVSQSYEYREETKKSYDPFKDPVNWELIG